MKISLSKKTFLALEKVLGVKAHRLEYDYSRKHSETSDTLTVDFRNCQQEDMENVHAELVRLKEPNAARSIKRVLNMLSDPHGKVARSQLSLLPKLLASFMEKHVEANPACSYLIRTDLNQKGIAYLPIACAYLSERGMRNNTDPYVEVQLAFNSHGRYQEHSITIWPKDLDQTIPQILNAKGYLMMTLDDMEVYKRVMDRYFAYCKLDKQQMLARGEANVIEDDYFRWWSTRNIDLSPAGMPTKVVIDLSDRKVSSKISAPSSLFKETMPVPHHPLIPAFSLAKHTFAYINVSNMKPYQYESIRDRLILPASHTKLIGALTSSLNLLRGNKSSKVLKAKAQSNIILAVGAPGTGKTLTAEVYAEEIKRPLYEVAAGQLGIDPAQIEENLQTVLDLSIRLEMPVLINEADVFITARGISMEQNAVCATFLRLTEYHTGLLFMTTNLDTIDDAMRSRCIAEIQYTVPARAERAALWRVQAQEFGIEFSDKEIQELSVSFPSVVGRDIQNLINLTLRYCKAVKQEMSIESLGECAMFKRIEYVPKGLK